MVANTTIAARSVEISISCLVKGYYHCPFKVKEGEVVCFFTKKVNTETHSKFGVKEPGQLRHQADLVSPLWPHQVDISALVQ